MTSKQEKALKIVKDKFKDKYPEYGVDVNGALVFSMIPNDDPGFGVVLDNFYVVNPDNGDVYAVNPAFYQEAFTQALEHPFYTDIR